MADLFIPINHFIDTNPGAQVLKHAQKQTDEYLVKHPTVYKVWICSCHILRTYMVLKMDKKFAVVSGLAYNIGVEGGNCSFGFAIPAVVGAFAYHRAGSTLVSVISQIASRSFQLSIRNLLSLTPLALYAFLVIVLANKEVNEKIAKIKNPPANKEKICCSN